MEQYSGKVLFGVIAIISIYVVLNAAFYYNTHEIEYPVYIRTPANDPLFISAQKTPSPIVTELQIDEKDSYMIVNFTATNTEKVGINYFECSVDMKPYVECQSPMVISKGNGNHTLEIRAIDKQGNIEEQPAAVILE